MESGSFGIDVLRIPTCVALPTTGILESPIVHTKLSSRFFFLSGYIGRITLFVGCSLYLLVQNIFFSNIRNQNIFLEKNHNPPFKLNGRSLKTITPPSSKMVVP